MSKRTAWPADVWGGCFDRHPRLRGGKGNGPGAPPVGVVAAALRVCHSADLHARVDGFKNILKFRGRRIVRYGTRGQSVPILILNVFALEPA